MKLRGGGGGFPLFDAWHRFSYGRRVTHDVCCVCRATLGALYRGIE